MVTFEDSITRLKNVYQSITGRPYDEEDEDTKGLTPYEDKKVRLFKKIQATRQVLDLSSFI